MSSVAAEARCSCCQKPAARLLVRADLGAQDDRFYVCGDPSCRPPEGKWQDYAMDGPALAKEFEKK